MKLTKSDLKDVIKECLLEILAEGLGNSQQNNTKSKQTLPPLTFSENTRRQPVYQSPSRKASPQIREAVKKEAGGNKIMEAIFADTAASTLPKMLQNEGRTPNLPIAGGVAEQVVAQADPDELFGGEAAAKWATLAFMDSPTKK